MVLYYASRRAGRIVSPEALENNYLIIGWAAAEGLLNRGLEWERFREIIHDVYYAGTGNFR